jgi:hypothetical protein
MSRLPALPAREVVLPDSCCPYLEATCPRGLDERLWAVAQQMRGICGKLRADRSAGDDVACLIRGEIRAEKSR